jgi:hypothetical protein
VPRALSCGLYEVGAAIGRRLPVNEQYCTVIARVQRSCRVATGEITCLNLNRIAVAYRSAKHVDVMACIRIQRERSASLQDDDTSPREVVGSGKVNDAGREIGHTGHVDAAMFNHVVAFPGELNYVPSINGLIQL